MQKMNYLSRIIITILIVSFVNSCGFVKGYAKPMKKPENTGFIITSLTATGYTAWPPTYYFRKVGTSERRTMRFNTNLFGGTSRDFPEVLSRYIRMKLEEGEYQIYGWMMNRNIATISSKSNFDIRFDVKKSKVTYIGELNMHIDRGGLLNTGVSGIGIHIKDSSERDLAYTRKHYPDFYIDSVQTKLMSISSVGRQPGSN